MPSIMDPPLYVIRSCCKYFIFILNNYPRFKCWSLVQWAPQLNKDSRFRGHKIAFTCVFELLSFVTNNFYTQCKLCFRLHIMQIYTISHVFHFIY